MTTITFESVAEAAKKMVEEGRNPTLIGVREILGGGSFSTISPLLKQWRESVGAPVPLLLQEVPEEIKSAMDSLSGRVWMVAMGRASAMLKYEREALDAEKEANEQMFKEVSDLAESLDVRLQDMTEQRDTLQKLLNETREELTQSERLCEKQDGYIREQTQALRDAESALKAAQARSDELADLLKTEQSARSRLEADASGLHQRIEVLTGNVAALQEQVKAIEQAKAELQHSYQKQVDDFRGQLESMSQSKAALQNTYQKQIDDMRDEVVKRDADVVAANARVEASLARMEDSARTIAKLEKAIESSRLEAIGAQKSAAVLEGRVGELEKQLVELKTAKKDKS